MIVSVCREITNKTYMPPVFKVTKECIDRHFTHSRQRPDDLQAWWFYQSPSGRKSHWDLRKAKEINRITTTIPGLLPHLL